MRIGGFSAVSVAVGPIFIELAVVFLSMFSVVVLVALSLCSLYTSLRGVSCVFCISCVCVFCVFLVVGVEVLFIATVSVGNSTLAYANTLSA